VTGRRWAVLLDRDGTMVRNRHHPTRPEQLRLYEGAGEALRRLQDAGARLILVSNQSAIARGLLDARGLARMDRALRGMLRPFGVHLSGSYYCPHHPDFTGPCRCRKPRPGLIRDALRDHGLRARDAYLVGDSRTDLQAGRACRLTTVLVLTGYGRGQRTAALRAGEADHVSRDLAAAAGWILRRWGMDSA